MHLVFLEELFSLIAVIQKKRLDLVDELHIVPN